MANLLVHATFALALTSVSTSLIHGTPLTAHGFYAALAGILPDLDGHGRAASRSPYGHSLTYGVLWALLAISGFALAAWGGLLSAHAIWPLLGAGLTGLSSHLLLDALAEPGILTRHRPDGTWGRIWIFDGTWLSRVNLTVSGLSVGTLVALVAVY